MNERAPDFRAYVLAELRVLSARMRADLLEIDAIGVALGGDLINAEEAVGWLGELGYSNALGINRLATKALALPDNVGG